MKKHIETQFKNFDTNIKIGSPEYKDLVDQVRKLFISNFKGTGYEQCMVHPLIAQILYNFFSIRFEQGFFWVDNEMITAEEALSNLNHFVDYYLCDDGDVYLINGELRYSGMDGTELRKSECVQFIIKALN